ncbi:site-2 protease family protein [Ruminococcaceae bacterium OttesenSCG-928-L11]|nr:site-2 protease family protein [Ruminococcaceae bacterium OttesenSCG-928-L11]
MKTRLFGIEISFSFWFFAVLLAVLVTGQEVLAFYFLLPVAIHELGHLVAMAAAGIRVERVAFRAFGIDIQRSRSATASYGRELAIAVGGVAANFLTALLLYGFAFQSMRVILLVSVNVALGLFNSLPVGTLDGGQILQILLTRWGSLETAATVSRICSFFVLIPLFALSILLLLRGTANVSLLVACVYLACTVIFSS